MSAILLRVVIFVVIVAALYFGIRSIIRDWRGRFRELDKKARERDLRERQRPDVIDLKRDDDGVFRKKDETRGDR
jgi:hypothetical protein